MSKKAETIVKLCFPKQTDFSDPDEFMDKLITLSEEKGKDNWGGFLGKSYLKDALQNKIDDGNHEKYQQPGKDLATKNQRSDQKICRKNVKINCVIQITH